MGIAFLTKLAFFGHLAGPDMIIILLIILLLFGARKHSDLMKGLDQARREFWETKDEGEHEITRHPAAQPPHLATPAFIFRLTWAFLILVSLILLFLLWLKNGH